MQAAFIIFSWLTWAAFVSVLDGVLAHHRREQRSHPILCICRRELNSGGTAQDKAYTITTTPPGQEIRTATGLPLPLTKVPLGKAALVFVQSDVSHCNNAFTDNRLAFALLHVGQFGNLFDKMKCMMPRLVAHVN